MSSGCIAVRCLPSETAAFAHLQLPISGAGAQPDAAATTAVADCVWAASPPSLWSLAESTLRSATHHLVSYADLHQTEPQPGWVQLYSLCLSAHLAVLSCRQGQV